jgi:hypothetical protein
MEKAYSIQMEDCGDYLHVIAGGDKLTAPISAAYWNEIAEKCYELDRSKILIEKDFAESVSPAEMLQMATHLAQILPERRIAFLDRRGHHEINELGKKLARNRDVMMQIFDNITEAEKWLRAN